MKNPVPASELAKQSYMQCYYKPTQNICNGGNTSVGAQTCGLTSGAFKTCFNCPSVAPSLESPVPPLISSTRCAVPDSCDMIYWDPIECRCTCTQTTGNATYCSQYPSNKMDNSAAIEAQIAEGLRLAAQNPNGIGSSGSPGSTSGKSGASSAVSIFSFLSSIFPLTRLV